MSDLIVPVSQTRTDGMLGASEAAAALGLDPYTSPLTLWKRLRGELVDEERSPALAEAAAWGQLIEPVVRGKYALDRRAYVLVPRKSSELGGWLRATPDGVVIPGVPSGASVDHSTATSRDVGFGVMEMPDDIDMRDPEWRHGAGLLQVKNRHAFARDDWRDGVPAKEQIQCRVEMAVCNLPWNDCAVLIGGNRMLVHRVERDLELEDRILTDLRAFWELVQTGKEPSPDASAAWRQHVSEKMRTTKVYIDPDDEVKELVAYFMEQRRKRKRFEEEEEAAKTDILLRLSASGAVGINLPDGSKLTAYQTGAKARWKEYAKSLGGSDKIPDQFKGKPGSWTIRCPGDEE